MVTPRVIVPCHYLSALSFTRAAGSSAPPEACRPRLQHPVRLATTRLMAPVRDRIRIAQDTTHARGHPPPAPYPAVH